MLLILLVIGFASASTTRHPLHSAGTSCVLDPRLPANLSRHSDVQPLCAGYILGSGVLHSQMKRFVPGTDCADIFRANKRTVSLAHSFLKGVPSVTRCRSYNRVCKIMSPGFINASAAPYAAVGDGVTDDTDALQARPSP